MASSCNSVNPEVQVFETSESGNQLSLRTTFEALTEESTIALNPAKEFQTITGFGGAFTESSAYLLNQMSEEKRNEILAAYFAKDGARYSLTRTHMNSCDFSLNNYSYTPVAGDKNLAHFSIDADKDDIIPMIQDAMAISEDGFKLFLLLGRLLHG